MLARQSHSPAVFLQPLLAPVLPAPFFFAGQGFCAANPEGGTLSERPHGLSPLCRIRTLDRNITGAKPASTIKSAAAAPSSTAAREAFS